MLLPVWTWPTIEGLGTDFLTRRLLMTLQIINLTVNLDVNLEHCSFFVKKTSPDMDLG